MDLRLERRGAVAVMTLARPPRNAVSLGLLRALEAACAELAADAAVRAVWLRAEGDTFSAGMDLRDAELATLTLEAPAEVAALGQRMLGAWMELPVFTVVSWRGAAVGAGACLVVGADLRLAAPGATLSFPEVDRGMPLGWGVVPRLLRELGAPTARWLAATGERCAVEALPPGFARVVADPDAAAEALAAALADKPAPAVRAIKRTFLTATEGDAALSRDDVDDFRRAVESGAVAEAVARFFAGRG